MGFYPLGLLSTGAFIRWGFYPLGLLSVGAFIPGVFVRGVFVRGANNNEAIAVMRAKYISMR